MKHFAAILAIAALGANAQRIQPGAQVEFSWPRAGRNGPCFVATGSRDGDAVVIQQACEIATQPNRTWLVPGGSAQSGLGPATQIRIHGSKCLDVRDGNTANGARLQIWACSSGNRNQIFNVNDQDQTIRWANTNKCLDLTGGNTTTGNPIQTWDCNGQNPNQWWFATTRDEPVLQAPVNEPVRLQPNGIVSSRFAPCLAAANNTDGAVVVTQDCSIGTPASRQWTAVKGGAPEGAGAGPATQIKIYGNKCLDVTNGAATAGTKLQIWTCGNNNPNQLWQVNGDSTISWAGRNFCLDLTGGNLGNGTRTQIWTCNSGNLNQVWNAVAPA